MGRFAEILKSLNPVNGYIITSDGQAWNRADRGRFEEKFDIKAQTIDNGAAEFSARFTVAGTTTYNIGFHVPEGRVLVLFYRDLFLPEGAYQVDSVNATWDTGTGSDLIVGTLDDRCDCPVQSTMRHGVTITGSETLRKSVGFDAGSQPGAGRPPAALDADDVIRVVTEDTVLKIIKTDGGDALCSVVYAAWEFDA